MSEFLRDLHKVRRWLAGVNPWTAAIVLLAAGVLGYYAMLGARYWNASRDAEALTYQVQQMTVAQRRSALTATPTAATTPERKLESLRGAFTYGNTDDMIAVVSSAARESGVALVSVSVGEAQPKTRGNVKYQTQPLSVRVQGGANAIYRYLASLQQAAPSATVTDIRFTGLDGIPLAQAQVLFYLSPEPAATAKEKKAAK
jgi:Tfp pilus assembly protein PilV